MATNAYFLNQYISTTLASVGGITDSATTGIILNSLTNIDYTKPGIACLSYTDPIDTSKAEWITYTSINNSTKELQGVTRGQEGYSAKAHDNGVTVAFPLSESHINNLNTALIIGGSATNLLEGMLDEDNMASDSATKGATQQSIKAYVDSKDNKKAPTTLTDDTTITIDHSLNTNFKVTLGGNRTLALSNAKVGKPILLDITQDGTGSRLITWFATTTDTVTMTIANPCVVTTTKDLPTTTPVKFTTTGALPTGITAGTTYYWIRTAATTGNLATSIANAQAGTTITTSGSQSGTHTMSVQIAWVDSNTTPTLTTGKYRTDTIGIMPVDVTNGVFRGYVVGQDS